MRAGSVAALVACDVLMRALNLPDAASKHTSTARLTVVLGHRYEPPALEFKTEDQDTAKKVGKVLAVVAGGVLLVAVGVWGWQFFLENVHPGQAISHLVAETAVHTCGLEAHSVQNPGQHPQRCCCWCRRRRRARAWTRTRR